MVHIVQKCSHDNGSVNATDDMDDTVIFVIKRIFMAEPLEVFHATKSLHE